METEEITIEKSHIAREIKSYYYRVASLNLIRTVLPARRSE